MSFYLPRWYDDGRWSRIDPVRLRWVERTEPRNLLWAAVAVSAAMILILYAIFAAFVGSVTAVPFVLWSWLLVAAIPLTAITVALAWFAQPGVVGVAERGVVFGRLGGDAVEWAQLIAARRSVWGVALDYRWNTEWWAPWSVDRGWFGTWSGRPATRYIDGRQFQAMLELPQCPSRLR